MKYLDVGQTELVDRAGIAYHNNALAPGQSVGQRGADSYVRDNRGTLMSQKSAAGRHYYLTDGHPGSVAALVDSAGNVAARYRYDPFGQDRGVVGSLSNSLRFGSVEYVPALKLFKMGERWYDPKSGRFTQQDPLNQPFDPKQANRYLYAGQDPVNLSDPTGYDIFDDIGDGIEEAGELIEENTGLSATELGGLGLDSAIGAAACIPAFGPVGAAACGVIAGATVVGGLYDAFDDNDDWWVAESSG
jgi:RHS repeat-associated protein